MNKRKIIIIVFIVIFVIICGFIVIKKSINKNGIENEKDIVVNNNVSGENLIITEEKEETLTELYTSTKGYEIRYDPNKFQFKYEDGKDKFIYIDSGEPIYLSIDVVISDDIQTIKNSITENAEVSGKCELSNLNLTGIYVENKKEEIVNQKLIFDLTETKLMIIEMNKYNKNNDLNFVNKHMFDMVKTIKYN